MSETSAGQFKVECACGKKLKLPVSAVGRRAKCPNCKSVFTVPSPPTGRAVSEPEEGASLLDDLATQARSTDAQAKPPAEPVSSKCTKCGANMPAGIVLCVACGHNVQTGRTLKQASARRSDIGAAARWMAKRAGTFAFGCLLSSVGALIGAAIWSTISIVGNVEIGIIAWVLGGLAGYGMAVGYPTENLRAGVTAACIAMCGIVGAKLIDFTYINYDELSEVTEIVMGEPDEAATLRFQIAYHRAERAAEQSGLSPYDSRRPGILRGEIKHVEAITPTELQDAYVQLEAWEAGAKWDDEQYVRNFLIYAYAEEATDKLYPPQEYEHADEYPTPTPREWKKMYEAAATTVDRMTPEQRDARVTEINDHEERLAEMDRLAAHHANLRRLRMGISYLDPRGESLFDEELERIQAFSDEDREAAITELYAWEDTGKWQDQEYMHNHLVELQVDEAMTDFENNLDVDFDDYEVRVETEWKEQHKRAVAAVDAIPVDQHAQHVRTLEARAQQRFENDLEEYEAQQTTAMAKEVAGSTLSFFFANYFDAYDVLFSILAIASAFKIATGGGED